jgi:hypothetical protein
MVKTDLDETRQSAAVNIATSADANGVEYLIHALCELRSQMTPPVPDSLKKAVELDAPVLEIEHPTAHMGMTYAGELRICVRHPGLGWLAFRLPAQDVEGLADLIGKKVPKPARTQ